MIKKLCSYPGCHKVVEAGVKYCDKHRETDRKKYREYKQRRMRDEQEARRQQFYNSKAWEQFRAAQAAAQLGIDIYEYGTEAEAYRITGNRAEVKREGTKCNSKPYSA